jgi:hypothetical protein
MTRRLVRIPLIVLVVYAGLIGLTGFQFSRAPAASSRSRTRAT